MTREVDGELVIDQFMWSYQPHFRTSVEVAVELAFKEIGFDGRVHVLLVGFDSTGQQEYPICIEPEEGPFSPTDLERVAARADELYTQNPERNVIHTHPIAQKDFHESLHASMRSKALEEALKEAPAGQRYTFFSSRAARIGDYDVHVVIGIDNESLATVPQLWTEERNRMTITPSLVHAVIFGILIRARRALYIPDAGKGIGVLGAETTEINRTAAARLVLSVLYCAGYLFGGSIGDLLSTISALPYEGRAGSGRIILGKTEHPAISVRMRFRDPIDFDDTRAVRKLIEASAGSDDLLSDGEHVIGFGSIDDNYDALSESVFTATFMQRGTWELSHDDRRLLRVQDGIPRLPKPPLNISYFQDLVQRRIPGADIPRLTELVLAASKNKHGAMLIISSDAPGEAARLTPQAWAVEPVHLSDERLPQLAEMDGGILIDANGRCHAVGVILDGIACGDENPARGSRYNNAVRYLKGSPPAAVVAVYSADGSIDVLPILRDRVKRSDVEAAVDEFVEMASQNSLQGRSEARKRVDQLSFYMTSEQCQRVNDAQAIVDSWYEDRDYIRPVYPDIAPNPEMNDSYWLPEAG